MRQKAIALYTDYKACDAQLKKDYPRGRTATNGTAYDKASQRCTSIKTEQNTVSKEYNNHAGVR